jgi:ketosteroid isomerase-like protein
MLLKLYHWIQESQWLMSLLISITRSRGGQMTSHEINESHEASSATMTRRAALSGVAAVPLGVQTANANDAAATLIARAAEKNAAFMRGDMQRWSELVRIAADFTLMQPFGGPASHGFEKSPERLEEMARYFRNGETTLELVQSHASEDMIVLVMIERQRAEVGGLPEQDWSLRVTEVYRRNGTQWQLAHRHADPLVRPITLEQAATLARGLSENERPMR